MAAKTLDVDSVKKTVVRLAERIAARFPELNLRAVAGELAHVVNETVDTLARQ